MPIEYLLTILRSRLWLILLTTCAAVAGGIYLTTSQPISYVGSTSLLIDYSAENPFDDDKLPAQLADGQLATQVDIIRSRTVALRVVDDLELAANPRQRDSLATALLRNLDVEPARESRIVQIRYESDTADMASRVANGFAEAYVDVTEELAQAPAARNAAMIDQQLDEMRKRLATAQERLSQYQRDRGIVAIDERLDTETTQLDELTSQLLEAQARTYDARSRQLGVNHPEYVRSVASEEALRRSVESQKQKLLELNQQRNELAVLAREVRVEEDAYEVALQNYYSQQLRSQFAQPRVEVLDPAMPSATRPDTNPVLNIVGSLVLGLILGIVLAVIAELTFRKVRSDKDINEALEVEYFGQL